MRKNIYLLAIFLTSVQTFAQDFRTVWRTTVANEQITIPVYLDGNDLYNYNVNWGDGTADNLNEANSVSHTYAVAGDYTVSISGSLYLYFAGAGDKDKIRSIENWGNIAWTSFYNSFKGCSNLVNNAQDRPDLSNVESLGSMFYGCTSLGNGTGNFNHWQTGFVKRINYIFRDATSFNKTINSWDTSAVTNMSFAFYNAEIFNRSLNNWDTHVVTNMSSMFSNAASFNQNLTTVGNKWNTSAVTSMSGMFSRADDFNGNISNWDTHLVSNMRLMFWNAPSFNQSVATNGNIWNTSAVTDMERMFFTATDFDQDISSWNVELVTNMTSIFQNITFSIKNYDALLIAWDAQNLQNGVTFHGGNSKYYTPEASTARANMIANDSWIFTADGGLLSSENWTGATSTDWNTATNWDEGVVPTSNQDIQVTNVANLPVISSGHTNETDNLTLNENTVLTINSGANLKVTGILDQKVTSSIVVKSNATSSGSLLYSIYDHAGSVTFERYLTSADWHLISVPLNGEDINDVSASLLTNGNNYALAIYDNIAVADPHWKYYTIPAGGNNIANAGQFLPKKGYSIKKTVDGVVSFTGNSFISTNDANTNYGISDHNATAGNKWNLVGNPYPSFISVNNGTTTGLNNFLHLNTDELDPARVAIYLWKPSTNSYNVINQASAATYIAPGQAFFVEAKDNGGNIKFNPAIRSHNSGDLFLRTQNNRPEITLSIFDGTTIKSTKIIYINGQSTGLDLGYDAGVFSGANNSFDVFTHLITDSQGDDFTLQVLPDSDFESMVIPVGIRASTGTEVSFTVHAENLPADINVYLEDRVNNTFTRLNQENATYSITLNANTNSIGQFYIHTTTSSALSVDTVTLNGVSIYKTNNTTVRIAGVQRGTASINIVNLLGKQVHTSYFKTNGVTDIALPRLSTGIYIVQLQTEKGRLNKKIIIE